MKTGCINNFHTSLLLLSRTRVRFNWQAVDKIRKNDTAGKVGSSEFVVSDGNVMSEISVMLKFTSPLICRHLVKHSNSNPVSRSISFIRNLKSRSVLLDKSKHKIIYEFPYIVPTAYVIRTKIWVPTMMTLLAPVGLLFSDFRITVLGGLVASWIHCALMHQMSKLLRNVVGKIYINEENELNDIIISGLDTNGNRIDRSHQLKDLVICDFSTKWLHNFGFITIYVNNTDIIYKLNIINCKFHSLERCATLFGKKWVSIKTENKIV